MTSKSQLTIESYLNSTLEQWAYNLNQIYGVRNNSRTLSEMWLRAVSDGSKVGEAVRKSDAFEAMVYLTHTFGWVITTTTKLLNTELGKMPALQNYDGTRHSSLTDVILSKYPNICPYCGKMPCGCSSIRRTVERESKAQRRARLNQISAQAKIAGTLPRTIPKLYSMFEDIYGQIHYGTSLESIAFHLLEEIGEVAWCITNLEDGDSNHSDSVSLGIQLSEEIADVVGWGFAVMSKLSTLAQDANRFVQAFNGKHYTDNESSLSWNAEHILPKYLWREFYNDSTSSFLCNHCKSSQCVC